MTFGGAFIHGAVSLATGMVTVVCILFVYCFMTNSWSILAPQPKHAPVFEFCYEGQFGNSCWDSQ